MQKSSAKQMTSDKSWSVKTIEGEKRLGKFLLNVKDSLEDIARTAR